MVKRAAEPLLSSEELFEILDAVKDPEVPVLSVVELGIVRKAEASDEGVVITITPTYSGCPAMHDIEQDIRAALADRGVGAVEIVTTYSPAWTSDWIGPEARAKLEAYGIAPPGRSDASELVVLHRRAPTVQCPYCKSMHTTRQSVFGSTACKAIWVCNDCQQPFEEFKAI